MSNKQRALRRAQHVRPRQLLLLYCSYFDFTAVYQGRGLGALLGTVTEAIRPEVFVLRERVIQQQQYSS